MAKKKIEIQEPELEVVSIDLEENEDRPIWYRTGIWATVAAIGGIASAALYGIWKSSKESPEPAVDMFKAPTQPIIPHVEAEPVVTKTIVERGAQEGSSGYGRQVCRQLRLSGLPYARLPLWQTHFRAEQGLPEDQSCCHQGRLQTLQLLQSVNRHSTNPMERRSLE